MEFVEDSKSALTKAAEHWPRFSNVFALLLKDEATNVNWQTYNGVSVLHHVIIKGKSEALLMLLQRKDLNVNYVDDCHDT